jgi:BON domain
MNLNSLITGPARLGLTIGGRVLGLIQSRLGGTPKIDDDTLQNQVEADVFGSRRVARSKVQVEVAEGVVWLRGEVKSSSVADEVEARAGAIEGVKRVENLLRVAKAQPKARTQKRPAPKRSARPKPAAATAPPPAVEPAPAATPPPAAQEQRPVTRRFNAERTPEVAEPGPAELAQSGEGRQPAPLGATETAGAAATGPAGRGGSPPAPFPSVANGSGADEGSG